MAIDFLLKENDIIGRYKVLKVLGSGAMGVVYQAIDPVIDRVVAIKTVHFQINQSDLAEYEARFAQEIKAAGKLNHPQIVTIYDVGKTEHFAYMAMEFIEGEELKALVAPDKPLPVAIATSIAAQVADGLAFAHSREIIHRDVKPSNIMVAETDEGLVAKIMDFGIARMPASSVKTLTGMILGSPRYMSPEQVIGTDLTAATDVFSLGVVLYEMLTGHCPFEGPNISAIMYATVNTAPPPPSAHNAKVPEKLDALVLQALAKEPSSRFASMREFARAMHDATRHIEADEWPPVPEERRVKLAPPKPANSKPEAATIRVKTDSNIARSGDASSAPAAVAPVSAPVPPMAEPAPVAPVASQAATAAPEATPLGIFDSSAGTQRLARYTQQAGEVAAKPAAEVVDVANAAEATEAAEATPAPANTAMPFKPGISLDDTRIQAAPSVSTTLPMAPLLLLGGLTTLVVVLAMALVLV